MSQKSHYQTFGHSYNLVPNVCGKRQAIQIKIIVTLTNTRLKTISPRYAVKGKGEPQSQLLYLHWSLVLVTPFPHRDKDVF